MAATVLVVEDERKLRDLVRSDLERAGFSVLTTGSGAEAITMAADSSPDLAVLDLELPDVPGATVARAVRAAAATPILMLTHDFEGCERTVDSHVKILRRNIEAGPASPQIIQSVLGGGCRLGVARDD